MLIIRKLVASLALIGALVSPSVAHADTWQVAGIVNIGEPSLRVVYDASVPGARATALSQVQAMQRYFATTMGYEQPGVITGLMQVGYSDHFQGVQWQLYGDSPYIDDWYFAILGNTLADYGVGLHGCWENPSVCPTWSGN